MNRRAAEIRSAHFHALSQWHICKKTAAEIERRAAQIPAGTPARNAAEYAARAAAEHTAAARGFIRQIETDIERGGFCVNVYAARVRDCLEKVYALSNRFELSR